MKKEKRIVLLFAHPPVFQQNFILLSVQVLLHHEHATP